MQPNFQKGKHRRDKWKYFLLVYILSNLLTVDLRVQVIVEKIKNNKIAEKKQIKHYLNLNSKKRTMFPQSQIKRLLTG